MLTTVEKVLFLKSIELFEQIPGEDLAQIALITEELTLDAGEVVFEEGEMGDALFLLIEGRVSVRRGDRVIAELGPGECFGEMAILDSSPRSATVAALEEASCLKIEREDFYDIMAEKPEIAQGVIKVLMRRLRRSIGHTPQEA
ncbi:MAG: cyclic nucleotide-binding domain-containing protein [Deltaproteobacteria bacterium]|nr:MAG: cyclic nucleotide-binding domain-containing protein [Deltaproteobacteria bacterium]